MDSQEFESLNPEEQAKVFHHSSFKERAELIRHSHDPRSLTRSLSHEELYLLTREMDIEDRSEVIRYATLPQLTFIADVDCWKKDRIDSDNFLEWLETLLAADERILLSWLLTMDYETIVAGFQKAVEVIKPEREYAADEVLGDTPYFSLDDMYYVAVREENLATVRRAIELLFENNKGRYYSLLEDLMSDFADQVEEDAFQNREMRLAERGFPDDETARKIYRPITREEFEKFPLKKNTPADPSQAPRYPVAWSKDRLFLDDVLLQISKDRTDLLETLHDELAWISNKVIACEGIDFSSEEKVRRGIERARFFVSLGLEALSNGDTPRARVLLEERWCEVIFRWGATSVLKLKDRVNLLVRDYWHGEKIALLDFLTPPYDHVAQGLLRQVPQCYDAEVKSGDVPLRDFKKMQDVASSEASVEQLEKIHQFFKRDYPDAFKAEANAFALLGTLFVSFVLKGKPSIAPIAPKDIAAFVEKSKDNPKLKENFIETVFTANEKMQAGIFMSFVFEAVEDELGSLDLSKEPDPRFVSCFLVKKKNAKA